MNSPKRPDFTNPDQQTVGWDSIEAKDYRKKFQELFPDAFCKS